jgi:hypothetical protein
MTLSLATSIIACVAAFVALVGTLTLVHRLRKHRAALRHLHARLLRFHWVEWWTRNAAEMTRADPSRPYLVHLAYAAALAPSLGEFVHDCAELAQNDQLPDGLRNAARSFAEEMTAAETAELPWIKWTRENGFTFHPGAQVFSYREALVAAVKCIPSEGGALPNLQVPTGLDDL